MITGKLIPTEYYPAILSGFPFGLIICNANGDFIYWNKEAIQILKTTKISDNKENWIDDFGVFSLDKERNLTIDELPMIMALKGVVSQKKMFLQNCDNPHGIYVNISGYPIFNLDNGNVEMAVILIQDITKEQKIFDDFLESLSELKNVINAMIKIDGTKIFDDIKKFKHE